MKSFTLDLRSAIAADLIEGVTSFVGEDETGRFGIQAGHERLMTSLVFGLSQFRVRGGAWEYLALPGALLYFADDRLLLATRRYLRDFDYERLNQVLSGTLRIEEERLRASRESLRHLEEAMLESLLRMERMT